jgi:hypothetical protein
MMIVAVAGAVAMSTFYIRYNFLDNTEYIEPREQIQTQLLP